MYFLRLKTKNLNIARTYIVYNSQDKGKDHLIERIESRNGINTILSLAKLNIDYRVYELINMIK